MSCVVGEIQEVIWNKGPNRVYFKGYAYFEGVNIDQNNKIKKSLIIFNDQKKFSIPVNNVLMESITEKYGNHEVNYDYAGFEGFIDLGFINDMKPISSGSWKIALYVNVGYHEVEFLIPYKGFRLLSDEKKELVGANPRIVYEVSLTCDQQQTIVLEVAQRERSQSEVMKKNLGNQVRLVKGNLIKHPIYVKTKKAFQTQKNKLGTKFLQNAYRRYSKLDIVENRVTFLSDSRVDFTGNFEFIHRELETRGGYEIKSLLKPSIQAKRSLREQLDMVYYLATSKYILLDDYYPQIYKYSIRPGVEVIQLWHATGAFKTFGFSRLGKKGGPTVRSKNHRNYTKAIVSSAQIKRHYAEAFGISEDRVIATGVPRTDIFFDETYKQAKCSELYAKYPMLKDKKVIMFAPTFRGNGQKTAHYPFEQLDVAKLYESFGEEYVIVMKLHPFIKDVPVWDEKYEDFILDLSHEREINDLLFVSDLLITDYSSVCFEYALLNRPMIFFAYDLEEYIASRDFYYPYEAFVPGPIVKSTEELIEVIQTGNFEEEKLIQFKNRFFDHLDGKSTQRVVDQLLPLKKEEEEKEK